MPKKYERIMAAVAAQFWAIQPEKLVAIMDFLALKAAGHPTAIAPEARMTPAQDRKIAAMRGNIAVMPLHGVVSHRMNMFSDISGGTSTQRFAKEFMSLVNNDDIKAIILDVDSPGGTVTGTPELADLIMGARGAKPIIAQVDGLCASAAFWIASAADEIVVSPSSEIGSVGVYSMHSDVSKMYEAMGRKETFIYAGEHKVEGNPFEPLSAEARAAMQARVDEYYGMFTGALAKGRGVTKSVVEKNFGQGRTFGAPDAVARGMADRVATMKETLERFGVSLYSGAGTRKAAPVERMKREAILIGMDTQ